MDREKVISGLETIRFNLRQMKHNLLADYCDDALALLKEQDAVAPEISESYRTQSGRMSRRRAWCGACGLGIRIGSNKRDRSNF